ncbi:hypothetical protein [Corallococcus llansteffanensis]|uniref:Uncharacterized protein n=1 Tax=Corallococcus llansteffanensis TaxID=2316731 RepID=A0A3A8QF34_9BACT|nr:hypothetical protein [Corallococcus llansteffanensis]RKH67299.1 hypothetical protein D7V93_03255 [Corallococcus llansteffanensis]
MSEPKHPGTIQFVDGATKEVTKTVDAKEVPPSIRYAKNEAGELVPVVKVVAFQEGDRRTLREYGPEGQFLRSTVQIRNAPR